ncbi:MAG: MBL fold metallo-hydrolase [Candidatus Poribacteria bacterium]|nr:MAG: MBL fold metallo-hydrolase [Candidatus Poribacteria bacterium]
MRQHAQLIESVAKASPPPGGLVFWWLGQHSFIVKAGGLVFYIDPYLSPHQARTVPPLLDPQEVTNADFVLCTHDHLDHIDPGAIPGIAQASPEAIFLAPRTARQRMLNLGVDEKHLVSLDAEDRYEDERVTITAIKAKHEFFDRDPELGYPYLGYVVETGGVAFYHAGDTIWYDGLTTTLKRWSLDVMFLPINGRDADRFRRNILGNFTFQEAVDVAGEVGPRYAIPTHYEMFAANSTDPQPFVDYLQAKYPHIRTWVGEHGEPVFIPPRDE